VKSGEYGGLAPPEPRRLHRKAQICVDQWCGTTSCRCGTSERLKRVQVWPWNRRLLHPYVL